MPAPNSKVTLTGLLADVRLLVILFVALRLSLLIAYQPLQVSGVLINHCRSVGENAV